MPALTRFLTPRMVPRWLLMVDVDEFEPCSDPRTRTPAKFSSTIGFGGMSSFSLMWKIACGSSDHSDAIVSVGDGDRIGTMLFRSIRRASWMRSSCDGRRMSYNGGVSDKYSAAIGGGGTGGEMNPAWEHSIVVVLERVLADDAVGR